MFDTCQINYTDYIRTTEERHKNTVEHFWNCLTSRGHIYRGQYEGWYCTSDEAYLTDDQVMESGEGDDAKHVSKESGNAVEWMKEDNYMFRLSQFHQPLIEWLDTNPISPGKFESQVRAFLDAGLSDLSVSRDVSRLTWGIPVPGDPSQTIYVWLDALVNYLTICGYPDESHWPADVQIIGKDILRFHAVYWPALLMAAGLKPPSHIVCHSHWLQDDQKMSKSRGNVVDVMEYCQRFSVDGLRYYLLRDGVLHNDGNFTDSRMQECLNSDLCNMLGNLLNRCTSSTINPRQVVPMLNAQIFHQHSSQEDKEMLEDLHKLPTIVDQHFNELHFYKGLEAIVNQLRATNKFLQHHEIWNLCKDPEQELWCSCCVSVALETLRVCGILLQATTPDIADTLLTRLAIPRSRRLWKDLDDVVREENKLAGRKVVLFKKV